MLKSVRGQTETPAADEEAERPDGWRAARPRLLWAGALLVAGAGLFWCYLLQSRTAGANADSAGMVLQGWETLHGNPLLRGWFLSDVSFYTFEVPIDGLVAVVSGFGADAVHVAAALEYTLLVVAAALLAKGRARGREGVVRALLAAGILAAPGFNPGTHVLLLAPDHTGIGVPVLLTLLLIDRAARRWWTPAAALVLLIWAQMDDLVASFALALPLGVVCAVRAVAGVTAQLARRRRAVTPAELLRAGWYDAALAVAVAASYPLTRLALNAIQSAGGFYVHWIIGGTRHAPWHQIPQQLRWTWENVLYLFGANYSGVSRLQAAFGYLHLVGVAVAICGVLLGVWGLFFRLPWPVTPPASGEPGPSRRADRVTQTLVAGVAVMLGVGAFGTHMAPVQGAHEIAVVLPFGAVLGGRLVGPWLAGSWRRAGAGARPEAGASASEYATAKDTRYTIGRATRGAVASVLVLAGAGYLAVLGYNASRPSTPAETQDLADWLVQHHLSSGLAGYWDANITTLASGGRVRVAPLANGGSYGYPWESRAAWYDPGAASANFIVTVSSPPSSASYARPKVVRARYGQPARTYHFRHYTIMVYDYNLLTRVRRPVADRL